ncbi:MAG: NAD(+)/NADH kinase [Candidatus Cloacimonetes bacterium]|nr:NAD(+)/NADH kinase [Candidatus Cloacimonadota bacterium]
MKKIGIYTNGVKENREFIVEMIDNYLNSKDIELYTILEETVYLPQYVKQYRKGMNLDAILVFGGDGTILGAVDFALESRAPILGVNMGKLGFLSDFSIKEFKKYIGKLITRDYRIYQRMLLVAEIKKNSRIIYRGYALNDAVIYKGLVSRLIEMRFYCDGDFVVETRCDGMIASTPTGSTAYSLSAGGPILTPEMEVFIVAPLCPHVLSVRPMVFPANVELRFRMTRVFNETMLQLDGKNVHSLFDGDDVIVKAAQEKVSFITLTGKNFYQTLRKKLHMGKI